MITKEINLNHEPYLILELEPINQKGKIWYLAKINAIDLLELYTVRPAKYDFNNHKRLAATFKDDSNYYEHLISIDEENLKKKDFQREPNSGRVKEIKDFLDEQEFAFFPNTIIATCDLINDRSDINVNENTPLSEIEEKRIDFDHLSFFYHDNDKPFLLVPRKENSILVIDGQHRLTGLEYAKDEVKDNYELLVAFIIGFDRSVVAKQFYTINYEQKPVNKSLLYQLTGEFSQDISEISFLHNVVKIMNELEGSPFYNRVKMLGTKPKNATPDEKKLLSISQAFLVDWLLKTLNKNAINSSNPPIFLVFYQSKDYHISIIRILMRYFNAVRSIKSEWSNPEKSLISLGLGVGALINVLQIMFAKMFIEDFDQDIEKAIKCSEGDFVKRLQGLEKVNFLKTGPFGRTSGASTISNIKEAIIINLEYFKVTDYQSFKDEFFRENGVHEKYKVWLKSKLNG